MNSILPNCGHFHLSCAGSARAHVEKAPYGGSSSSLFLRRQHSFGAAQKLSFHDAKRSPMKWPLSGRRSLQSLLARASLWEQSRNKQLPRGGRAFSACRNGGSCNAGHTSIHSLCETSACRHRGREHRRCHRTLLWQPLDRRKCPRLTCLSDAASSAASTGSQHELKEADKADCQQWDPTQVLHGKFTSGVLVLVACMHRHL